VPNTVVTRPALWLLGHGISASPSPAMQNAALRACGLDWEYALHDVEPASLAGAFAAMRSGVARGANVTIPHKRAAAALCDALAGDALLTGAVNTVIVEEGRLVGDNTDALGLEGALRSDHLWPEPGATVVVLGAGGAAAAAVLALSRSMPAHVTVVARDVQKALDVKKAWDAKQTWGAAESASSPRAKQAPTCEFHTAPWQPAAVLHALHSAQRSVLINATPAALPDLPVDLTELPPTTVIIDLRYRPRPVDLVAAARASGLRAQDGLGMLLHQGMLSFQRWTGLDPPWQAAQAALQAAVSTP